MNIITQIIWLILNIFFGAGLACILFNWVACDMQMPLIIKNFISNYAPIFYPIFNVPYVYIDKFSSSVICKLIFNGFLYVIFGFIHTFFAQEFVQKYLQQMLFPQQTLRTVYCILVSITAFILMGFWQYTHIQLWNLLPSTISTYDQQWILLITYNIIYLPGKENLFFHSMKNIFDCFLKHGM